MIQLDRRAWLEIVAEASRAPSAHNAQPARFRIAGDRVAVLEDVSRRLPVADPTGRDHLIGLGTALEGLSLALSRRGMALADATLSDAGASARLIEGATPDPLALLVPERHTWRRKFRRASPQQLDQLRRLPDVSIATETDDLARLNDACAAAFLARSAYQRELRGWMRLTNGSARDGLTPECLGLSPIERVAARLLFEPAVFAALARRGWHRPLIAEAGRLRTASAMVILHRPRGEHGIATGRRFYRLWLELTRLGLAACPMSALADAPDAVIELRRRYAISDDRAIINVFAVGVATGKAAISPRLPADELMV